MQHDSIVLKTRSKQVLEQTWRSKHCRFTNGLPQWTSDCTLPLFCHSYFFPFPNSFHCLLFPGNTTTIAIESVDSVIRKFTRNRKIYSNEESALKRVTMSISEPSKNWTRPIPPWKQALHHFAVMYEDRFPELTSN